MMETVADDIEIKIETDNTEGYSVNMDIDGDSDIGTGATQDTEVKLEDMGSDDIELPTDVEIELEPASTDVIGSNWHIATTSTQIGITPSSENSIPGVISEQNMAHTVDEPKSGLSYSHISDGGIHVGYKIHMTNVTVPVYDGSNGRNYTKADWCYYCQAMIKSKISRHYTAQHWDRDLVRQAITARGQKKIRMFYKLQQLGNFLHNSEVVRHGEGELSVVRRPNYKTEASKYVPCTLCLGFFHIESVYLHTKTCPLRGCEKPIRPTNTVQEGIIMLQPYLPKVADVQKFLIDGMKETKENKGLVDIIKGDSLIVLFAEQQLMRKGTDLTFTEINQIRIKLRHLARLLVQIRSITNSSGNFVDYIQPKFYGVFVRSVQELRRASRQIVVVLGSHVKTINMLNTSEAIKQGDMRRKSKSEKFRLQYESSWAATVTSSTLHLQQKKKKANTF